MNIITKLIEQSREREKKTRDHSLHEHFGGLCMSGWEHKHESLFREMLVIAVAALQDHITTGTYSGHCTGDAYNAKEALAELARIASGEGET